MRPAASIDFETYSEAGFRWDGHSWQSSQKGKPGLKGVGAWVYSEHPSTDLLCLAYRLEEEVQLWTPSDPPPMDLFAHMEDGSLVEAVNSAFEYAIWCNVAMRRYGWPPIDIMQLRDVAAMAGAMTYPRGLDNCAKIMQTPIQKDAEGHRVMMRLSKPNNPTHNANHYRYTPENAPEQFAKLYSYCRDDVRAEDAVRARVPDLSPRETQYFLTDQRINARGAYCDRRLLDASQSIIGQAAIRYNAELYAITGGEAKSVDELDRIKGWLAREGLEAPSLASDPIIELLERTDLSPEIRRVLEIRQILGAKSVGKVPTMRSRLSHDDRLRGLYIYAGASRTWRWSGADAQPQNLPSEGPPVCRCSSCQSVYWSGLKQCPSCFRPDRLPASWGIEAAEGCIAAVMTRSLDVVESQWGEALRAVSGCLRSCYMAAPGHDLISSDLNAIEGVVLSELAGEEWRNEVFHTHGMIYETTAANMYGIPLEEFVRVKRETGAHHPKRKYGKVATLSSGYGGWVDSFKAFGADKFMSDDEIETAVKAWREANPSIVKFWHLLERQSIAAVDTPGTRFPAREITFEMRGSCLYMHLPSGRYIPYQHPQVTLEPHFGKMKRTLSYMTLKSQKGWLRVFTRGAKLAGNATQACARDIFAPSLVRLEAAGYPVVLHTHDEPVCEVPTGYGSVEEVEAIMGHRDPWCERYAVSASGGWRGKRYRKD